jgi:hypothetical protein
VGELPYKISLIAGRAVLPPGGVAWYFAEWNDATEKIRLFKERRVGRRIRSRERIPVELALIHRPDNDYNPHAISIAAPAHYGGDRDSRFFGYFYDHQLREIGMRRLSDLSDALSGAEISCTGIATRDGLEVDLPEPAELARAIDEFLGYDDSRIHKRISLETESALSALQVFTREQQPVEGLRLTARFGGMGRRIQLEDRTSRRLLGHIDRSYLLLEDERDRDAVLRLLSSSGQRVAGPINEASIPLEVEWPVTRVPNLQIDVQTEVYLFPPVAPIGRYNPKTRKLWIEDSRLAGPSLCYAARLGLKVDDVGLPKRPWRLEDEVAFDELRDYGRRNKLRSKQEEAAASMICTLADAVSAAGLERLITKDTIEAKSFHIMQGALDEKKDQFQLNESFVPQRQTLFGEHTLADKSRRCRLCGQKAWTFTTIVCTGPLTYCQQCLEFASEGVFENRPRAADALKLIAELEFSNEPMLEGQLDTLHIDPRIPVPPEVTDQLLLLRFTIKRGKFPWTLLLEKAGLAQNGFRLSRGTLIRARDGHKCLSLGEKAVCDFLYQFGIKHDREPMYPVDSDLNPLGRQRADWKLADGTLVELWGLPNNPAYAARMLEKRALAVRHGLPLIELTEHDLRALPLVFARWLPLGTPEVTFWTWSPILKPLATTPIEKTGTDRGRNPFNVAARRDRLERCRRAFELQSSGFTRREIAEALGVSADSVKVLLRDGKFFTDPASDQERLQRASAAALAQSRGLTREQFQKENGLTAPKVKEAWKDADVIDPTPAEETLSGVQPDAGPEEKTK